MNLTWNSDLRPIPSMLMRGGISRGPFFLASDLPSDEQARNRVLLGVMGSPGRRQTDELGGAHPLTSKVGFVSRSTTPGVGLDSRGLAQPIQGLQRSVTVEHPTGKFTVELTLHPCDQQTIISAALLRTARPIMRGEVMISADIWKENTE